MDHEEHEEAELDEDGGLRGFVRGGRASLLERYSGK